MFKNVFSRKNWLKVSLELVGWICVVAGLLDYETARPARLLLLSIARGLPQALLPTDRLLHSI